MEHYMDVDMFLDRYVRWKVGSPHHSIILHEMFLYAAEQRAEGGRMNDPLGLPTWLSKVRPTGRHLCFLISGTQD